MTTIIGRKAVFEALKNNANIEKIYMLFGQKGDIITQIRILAKKKNVNLTEMKQDKFSKYTQNPNAQGIVALVSAINYVHFSNLVDEAKKSKRPLVLILDSIQDTHNLGAILRTAECAGVDGIVITKHNSAPINDTVIKTSAGAVNYLKISMVPNLVAAMEGLKENGFWIIGTSLDATKSYDEVDYNMPVGLVVGNEEKGIRRLAQEKCDILVKIPMLGKLQSLNVSVAAGIMLYQIRK